MTFGPFQGQPCTALLCNSAALGIVRAADKFHVAEGQTFYHFIRNNIQNSLLALCSQILVKSLCYWNKHFDARCCGFVLFSLISTCSFLCQALTYMAVASAVHITDPWQSILAIACSGVLLLCLELSFVQVLLTGHQCQSIHFEAFPILAKL